MTTAAVKAAATADAKSAASKPKVTTLTAVHASDDATPSPARVNKTPEATLSAVKRSQGARNHAINALIAMHPEDWAVCRKAGREAFGIKDHTEAREAKERAEFERLAAKYGTESKSE